MREVLQAPLFDK
ncbi:unnamed protein product, partial [Allacma fusca]